MLQVCQSKYRFILECHPSCKFNTFCVGISKYGCTQCEVGFSFIEVEKGIGFCDQQHEKKKETMQLSEAQESFSPTELKFCNDGEECKKIQVQTFSYYEDMTVILALKNSPEFIHTINNYNSSNAKIQSLVELLQPYDASHYYISIKQVEIIGNSILYPHDVTKKAKLNCTENCKDAVKISFLLPEQIQIRNNDEIKIKVIAHLQPRQKVIKGHEYTVLDDVRNQINVKVTKNKPNTNNEEESGLDFIINVIVIFHVVFGTLAIIFYRTKNKQPS